MSNPLVYLRAGDIYVSRRHERIVTVLGSCVGTIWYVRRLGLGGMSHAMFPDSGKMDGNYPAGYFVDTALELMLAAFKRRGVVPTEIRAWVFGGSGREMLAEGRSGIGHANFDRALMVHRELGLDEPWTAAGCRSGQRLTLDLIDYRVYLSDLGGEEAAWPKR